MAFLQLLDDDGHPARTVRIDHVHQEYTPERLVFDTLQAPLVDLNSVSATCDGRPLNSDENMTAEGLYEINVCQRKPEPGVSAQGGVY